MKNYSILLIEDNDVDVHITTTLLNCINQNFSINRCRNGEEAIQLLSAKDYDMPNVILLDINMPVMDGKEFLRQRITLSAAEAIPVIMVTSSAALSDKKECFELGAVDYLEKPVSTSILKEKLSLFILDLELL